MAESRPQARRGARHSGTYAARAAAKVVTDPRKEKSSGRSTLVGQRLSVLPNLDNDTPRVMLRRIIQTQPQVSPVTIQIPKHEGREEAQSEPPSKRVSSMGEMQLPDLPPEETFITTFHRAKKRKKLSISEFERAADRRLPQNKAQSALDSTALARSLRLSLGALLPADSVEKRGLLRRPRQRRAIDLAAFEGGVEQNMLKRKGQSYLVDSQSVSGMQTATLTSEAEIMLSNTELFVQPQLDEQSQNKLSALEAQLSDSKSSAQKSQTSDAAEEEARLENLGSSVGANEGRTPRYSENLILDHQPLDRMTRVSPKTPGNQQEEKQDRAQQRKPVDQLSASEEVVAGTVTRWSSSVSPASRRMSPPAWASPVTLKSRRSFRMSLREIVSSIIEDLAVSDAEEELANPVKEVEQEERFREAAEHHASPGYSEQMEKTPSKAAEDARGETETASAEEEGRAEGSVEHQGSPEAEGEMAKDVGAGTLSRHSLPFASEKAGLKPLQEAGEEGEELEDQALTVEWHGPEEEPTEGEAEDPESEEVSMKTPSFVRAAASRPLLAPPPPAKLATPKLSAKPPAPKPPLQPLKAKAVPKSSGVAQRKPREPQIPRSLVKKIFSHYVKMPVARDAFKIVEKCSERYFKQLSDDLEAYTNHAGRKTVELADLKVLLRRQGLVTDKMPLQVLIERYLPLEYRKLLIPVAMSGNKVVPSKMI